MQNAATQLVKLIYSQNSYHQIKSILEGVLDLLSLFFWGWGWVVSVVKNKIATCFGIGRIVVIYR